MKFKKVLATMTIYAMISVRGLESNASAGAGEIISGEVGNKEAQLEAGISAVISDALRDAKEKAEIEEKRKKKEERKERKRLKKEKERLAAEEAAREAERKRQELEIALLDFQDTLKTRNETIISITNEVGSRYGIKPTLLQAIIWYESTNYQYAENRGCYGYMQVSPKWHYNKMQYHQIEDIFDQYGNILLGTEVLAEYLEKTGGNLPLALMYYNGDSRASYLNSIGEMSSYARKIINLDSRLTLLEETYAKYK